MEDFFIIFLMLLLPAIVLSRIKLPSTPRELTMEEKIERMKRAGYIFNEDGSIDCPEYEEYDDDEEDDDEEDDDGCFDDYEEDNSYWDAAVPGASEWLIDKKRERGL